jgi:hypothetical protein
MAARRAAVPSSRASASPRGWVAAMAARRAAAPSSRASALMAFEDPQLIPCAW